MSFLETQRAESAAPVWPTLERAQKDEVVATLARLIAKASGLEHVDDDDKEAHDE